MQVLSQRLKRIASYVHPQAKLADIGSDHAYLPIYLCQNKRIVFAIATEVVEGPFYHAQGEVQQAGLKDKIDVRLGDGLDVIQKEDDIDTIVIAGMGGRLIVSILEAGRKNEKLSSGMHMILQPNNEEEYLRRFLLNHHFQISSEAILEENNHYYEIISANYEPKLNQNETWSNKEIYLGKYVKASDEGVFQAKYQDEYNKLTKILANIQQAKTRQVDKEAFYRQRLDWIKEEVPCL